MEDRSSYLVGVSRLKKRCGSYEPSEPEKSCIRKPIACGVSVNKIERQPQIGNTSSASRAPVTPKTDSWTRGFAIRSLRYLSSESSAFFHTAGKCERHQSRLQIWTLLFRQRPASSERVRETTCKAKKWKLVRSEQTHVWQTDLSVIFQ